MSENNYSSKLFSILGDSMSTLFGYSRPIGAEFYSAYRRYETGVYYLEDTWWGQVISALGGYLLVNDSFSGSTVCSETQNEIGSYGCSDVRTSSLGEDGRSPDVIMILMGINDMGKRNRIYPECEDEREDLSIFSVAYNAMIAKLRRNYPLAEIWCITLPLGKRGSYEPLEAVVSTYREYSDCIAKCAKDGGCRLIDICGTEPYDSIDGLHPNASGMKTISLAVLDKLKNIR